MNKSNNTKGITLIEVVIASTLLVVVTTSLFGILEICLHNYRVAGEKTQLTAAGKGILEEVIAAGDFANTQQLAVLNDRYPGVVYDLNIENFKGSDLKVITVSSYRTGQKDKGFSFITLRAIKDD
jgi:Tfp pilus assembly protein PilV